MKNVLSVALGALLAATLVLPVAAVENEYLVVFRSGTVDSATARQAVEDAGGTVLQDHSVIGVVRATASAPDFAAAIERVAGVAAVHRDNLRTVSNGAESGSPGVAQVRTLPSVSHLPTGGGLGNVAAAMVTDPTQAMFFPFQWNMQIMQADDAWAAGFLGDPSVKVAILDTGVDFTHPELVGTIDVANSISFVPEDDLLVQQLFPGANPIVDLHYHGTFMAGQIACNAIGTACLAPHSKTVAVKVINANLEASVGRYLSGILYAADLGVDAIVIGDTVTVSRGTTEGRAAIQAMHRAIVYAQQQGAIVLNESGIDRSALPFIKIDADNNGLDVLLPAEAGALVFASSDFEDTWGNFSNFGVTLVDLVGPGAGLPFEDPLTDTALGPCSQFTIVPFLMNFCQNNVAWVSVVGGIPAVAQAGGLVALIDSATGNTKSPGWIRQQLIRTADDLEAPGFDALTGHGRINAFRALTE